MIHASIGTAKRFRPKRSCSKPIRGSYVASARLRFRRRSSGHARRGPVGEPDHRQRHHRPGAEPQPGDADGRLSDGPDRRANDQFAADAGGGTLDPAAVPRLGPVERPGRGVRVRAGLVHRPLQRPHDGPAAAGPEGHSGGLDAFDQRGDQRRRHRGADLQGRGFRQMAGQAVGQDRHAVPARHGVRTDRAGLQTLDQRRAGRAQHLCPTPVFARCDRASAEDGRFRGAARRLPGRTGRPGLGEDFPAGRRPAARHGLYLSGRRDAQAGGHGAGG